MKRAITGIVAASLTLGTMAPAAFAATASTTQYFSGHVTLGSYSAGVSGVVANDAGHQTGFFPFYYVNQALSAAGYTVAWDGTAGKLSITTPSGVTPDLTNLNPGSGKAGIYINGTLVQNAPFVVAKDNGGKGVATSFMPIYYINQALKRVGIDNTYNAGNWTLTQSQLAIVSAKQTSATTVAVTFNKAVPSGTTVALSQNGVNYNATVAWDSTKSVATLTTAYALPAGTYTVTSGTLTQNVTLAASTPSKVVLGNGSLQSIAGAPLTYSFQDQFGTDVTSSVASSSVNVTAYDTTTGQPVVVSTVTNSSAQLALGGVNKGDSIVVTVTDATDAISVTKTLTVVGASNVASVTLGAITDNGSANVYVNDTPVKFALTAKDQYGNALTLPAGTANASGVLDGIQFVSSANGVVNPASNFTIDSNGNLTFTAGNTAGSATITAVVLATGQTASTSVTVASKTGVNSFKVSAPTTMVQAGAATVIPYTALDSFNQPITQANFGATQQGLVTITSSNTTVVPNNVANVYFDASNALNVKPAAAGSTTLYVYLNGTLQNSINLTVNAASYPAAITGLNKLNTEFVNDATATETVSASNFNIVDQYGQPYTPATGDTLTLTLKSGTAVLGLPSQFVANTGSGTLTPTTTVGSEVVTATYSTAGATHTATYSFNASTVAPTSVTAYSISAPTTLYDGVNGYVDGLAAANYAQAVTVNGTDASGNTVVLPSASQAPSYITSSDPTIVGVNAAKINGVKAGTATVTAYNASGTKLGTANVTVSDVQPAAKSVSFSQSSFSALHTDAVSGLTSLLSVTDQYGVTLPVASGYGYWTSSNSAVVTGGATPAFVAAGTATVTYIAPNGVSASITVSLS